MSGAQKISVLMVCLGNICRSPMAEAVLKHQISERASLKGKYDFKIDSAGTGAYHAGDSADERTVATLKKHSVPISCRARAVEPADYQNFDYILAMDTSNLQTLLYKKPSTSRAHISLFGSFDPALRSDSARHARGPTKAQSIVDPYYGGNSGFEDCYHQCLRYSSGFLDYIEQGGKPHPDGLVTLDKA